MDSREYSKLKQLNNNLIFLRFLHTLDPQKLKRSYGKAKLVSIIYQ